MALFKQISFVATVLTVFTILLHTTSAALLPVKNDKTPQEPHSLEPDFVTPNINLFEEFSNQLGFDFSPISTRRGSPPIQWPVPNIFKRQTCPDDYCFPDAPGDSCKCGYICCTNSVSKTGWCCATGYACDVSITDCKEITVTSTMVMTTTSVIYNYRTSVSSVGAMVTETETISSVTVVIVSSAATPTVVDTVTISSAIAKRAQTVLANSPADVPKQPKKTALSPGRAPRTELEHSSRVSKITPKPTSPNTRRRHIEKRTATITVVASTVTVYSTSFVDIQSTVSYTSTQTSSTTEWETSTTVLNAQVTVHTTTTRNIAETRTTGGNDQKPTTANEENSGIDGGGGLSKSTKIGLGAGIGVGVAIIAILLAILLRRRSAKRKLENQTMINNAVAAAVAANSQQSPQDKMPPMAPSPVPYGTSNSFHTAGAGPGYGQHGCYREAIPDRNQGYSPELPASPVQRPFEMPLQTRSPPPAGQMAQDEYPVAGSR